VSPRYDQISLNIEDRHNKFQQVLSPNSNDSGVWIHQEAWFSMIDTDEGKSMNYRLKNPEKNGVYLFVLNGKATINNQLVEDRDGYGLWNTSEIEIVANSNAELLVMEVPMSNR
jgi:redox-sensitive bicupin YhaK (pirin superfamily)